MLTLVVVQSRDIHCGSFDSRIAGPVVSDPERQQIAYSRHVAVRWAADNVVGRIAVVGLAVDAVHTVHSVDDTPSAVAADGVGIDDVVISAVP